LLQSVSQFLLHGDDDSDTSQRPPSQGNESHQSAQGNQNFELLDQLATSATVANLIDVYFESYNRLYPVLHEGAFRHRFQKLQRGGSASWKITVYMVLSLGHWMSSPESEHRKAPYFSTARANFTTNVLESGSLLTVQACLLMVSSLLQKQILNSET
jgi:transcriptional regulatory protein GAL4